MTDEGADQPRQSRRSELAHYEPARRLLGAAMGMAPGEKLVTEALWKVHAAILNADIDASVDEAWRASPSFEGFLKRQQIHEKRQARLFDDVERVKKKKSEKDAIEQAIRHFRSGFQDKYKRMSVRAFRSWMWQERIARALIFTLERELGRVLEYRHVSATSYGPDPDLLATLFEAARVVSACRRVASELPNLSRGKGVRKPGSANWFASQLRTLRKHRSPSSTKP